jgi:hypothetical protein
VVLLILPYVSFLIPFLHFSCLKFDPFPLSLSSCLSSGVLLFTSQPIVAENYDEIIFHSPKMKFYNLLMLYGSLKKEKAEINPSTASSVITVKKEDAMDIVDIPSQASQPIVNSGERKATAFPEYYTVFDDNLDMELLLSIKEHLENEIMEGKNKLINVEAEYIEATTKKQADMLLGGGSTGGGGIGSSSMSSAILGGTSSPASASSSVAFLPQSSSSFLSNVPSSISSSYLSSAIGSGGGSGVGSYNNPSNLNMFSSTSSSSSSSASMNDNINSSYNSGSSYLPPTNSDGGAGGGAGGGVTGGNNPIMSIGGERKYLSNN